MAKPPVPDELRELVRPLLPPPKPRRRDHPGRKPIDDRKALPGIRFVLKTGIPWEDLPAEMGCGSGMTCWRRLRDWQHAGVWSRLHELLLAKLHAADQIDWSRAAVAANVPDVQMLLPFVDSVPPVRGQPGPPRQRPEAVYADRAYDSESHREKLRGRGIEPRLARRNTDHGSGLGSSAGWRNGRCPGYTAFGSCGRSRSTGSTCNTPSWTWRCPSSAGAPSRRHSSYFVSGSYSCL